VARRTRAARPRAQRPDLVHTHSGKAGVLGRLAAHAAGVPLIVHTIHGPSFGAFQGPLANALFRVAEQRAGRVTTHFVSVAHAMTEQYLAAGIGTPAQYTRIFSGFDLEPFLNAKNDLALRAKLGLGPDDFVVGKVARLFEHKGHRELLVACLVPADRHPNLKVLLVGDGVLRSRLERLVQTGKLAPWLRNRVVFTGLVRPEEVPSYIGIMDAVVHLSRREGLARVLPQALAAGKPVIAYDCDGAREVCLNNETGFLVKAGDMGVVMGQLLRTISDEQLRVRLGARGRELVKECFPTQRMVDELHALYLRLQTEAKR
jgi:glycosyltransferase involved in cell wall biosynthesis